MGAISATSPPQISPISRQHPTIPYNRRSVPFLLKKSPFRKPKSPGGFAVCAEGNGSSRDEARGSGAGDSREDLGRDSRPPAFNLRWRDLLDPNPENLLAVGLAGLLTWASVQVLWQLFFISAAILLAALKYSFIAALLLFILITLL